MQALCYGSYEVFDTSHRSCCFRGLVLQGCQVSTCVCECARVYPLAVLYLPITVHMYRESKQFCASVEAPIFDNLLKWKEWMAVLLFMVAFSQLGALSWGGLSTLAAGAGGKRLQLIKHILKEKSKCQEHQNLE